MVSSSAYTSFAVVDKVLASREPLYLQNTTKPPMRILMVSYPSAEGEQSFAVPRTNIPFNICDYVEPESLRSSRSFRAMLNSGHLAVVKAEDAEKVLADPARVSAFRAAYGEANNTYKHRAGEVEKTQRANAEVRADQQKSQSGAMKNMIQAMDPTLAKALNITTDTGGRPDPKLIVQRNPRLSGLESRVKAGGVDSETILSDLSLMLGDLTQSDLESIASDPVWPQDVQIWARERISFMMR